MSDNVEPSDDQIEVNHLLRSFHNEQSDSRTVPVTNISITTGPKGFRWRGKEFTVGQGESDDFERPGDLIRGFSKTVTADDLWEPVCTITGSSSSVDLSERTKKCVVTSSSSGITLQGDRNVIVVGGSSNTVVASSGRVMDIPPNMIPMMDRGSLVVTQDGEIFGGTQVFVTNFSNTINVLGDDNLIFTTGAFGTSVSSSLGSSAVGPGAFYNVGLMSHDRADFAGEIRGAEDCSKNKRDFTLGLAGALVAHRQKNPSVDPEEGSSWAHAAVDMVFTEDPTARANLQEVLSVTSYSEEGDVATAYVDGIRYKGRVNVDWTIHVRPSKDSETSSTDNPDQPPVLDRCDVDGSTVAEEDGSSVELPIRQAYVEDGSDSDSDFQVIGTPTSASSVTGL